jgi:hypothetical protein
MLLFDGCRVLLLKVGGGGSRCSDGNRGQAETSSHCRLVTLVTKYLFLFAMKYGYNLLAHFPL